MIDHTCQYWVDWFPGFLQEAGDLLDIVMIGDDLAGQYGPLFSPAFYRKVVKPRHQRVVSTIKKYTKAKIWYHTCGDCSEYIPDLLENGIDILNPVQISAPGMDPARLKQKYGKNLVFWGGGIDSQHVLPFANPDKIKAEVRKNIEIFKPGGGYISTMCTTSRPGFRQKTSWPCIERGCKWGGLNSIALWLILLRHDR